MRRSFLQRLIATLDGWKQVAAVSGFRTQEEQEEIWRDTQAKEGWAFTQKYVALPGHSEHQTGLAIDLAAQSARIDLSVRTFRTQASSKSSGNWLRSLDL